MSQTLDVGVEPPPARDERVVRRSSLSRLLTRPEIGALLGAIVIFIVFFIVAPPFRDADSLSTILYVSSTYGIPAVAVALLMIGGEFDLSAGVAVTSVGAGRVDVQLPVHREHVGRRRSSRWWSRSAIGFINGYLVVKTGIPSFLVTLGTFFMLRGLNLAVTKLITGNVGTNDVSNIQGFDSAQNGLRLPVHDRGRVDPDHAALVDPVRRRSPPGSCCAPTSATGSSPSAARRPAPGRSASR